MNVFARSLQHDILAPLQKPWGTGPNPLVLIGLTEAILDLGLSEEQLHATVRSYARQLSAQVHPDRAAGFSLKRQQEIIGAFNAIENLEQFQACLIDFKNARAEERHEIGVLRTALQGLRQRLEGEDSGVAALHRQRDALRLEILAARRDLAVEQARMKEAYAAEWKRIDDYKRSFRTEFRNRVKRRLDVIAQEEGVLRAIRSESKPLLIDLAKFARLKDTRWWRALIGFG